MFRELKKLSILASVIIFVLLFSNVSYVFSSAISDLFGNIGGKGYCMFGPTLMNLNDLNTKLKNKGYTEFSNNFVSLGGGGHAVINKMIIGGEGHAVLKKSNENDNYENAISAGYGFFNIGRILYGEKGLHVYPMVGIGGGSISLKINDKTKPSFDDILNDPKRQVEISKGGFLINLSVTADYLHDLNKIEMYDLGIVYGVRIGYIFDPTNSKWEMNDNSLSDSPSSNVTGPYIRFTIGGGSAQQAY